MAFRFKLPPGEFDENKLSLFVAAIIADVLVVVPVIVDGAGGFNTDAN